ncbi:hypothetical protein PR202_gb09511 [Eleusine coracana subsp. coracana]|uniref:ZF-HD dimerization-type domain-containing protein n=1 Tax=Eleusine coracana subsp. coracana TaxID=191504 RepID=A0AAV5EHF6_ELECO|nr:hypothetical protein PR202_gb09511 [Eleusine coracana subsp. coracana]
MPPPPGFLHQPHHQRQAHTPRRERQQQHHHRRQHHEPARNGTAAPLAVAAEQWRYRECQRNHAARLGAHVLDGCCEFMPSAADGPGALACAACGCHRSFHRREPVPGGAALSPTTPTARAMPLLLAPPHMQQPTPRPHHAPPVPPQHPHPPPAHQAPQHLQQLTVIGGGGSASAPPMAVAPGKKRFRTKFTAEQKERMREFAQRVGWRIHKPDSDAVDAFCAQVCVPRRVLKVWMHNNKHLAKMPPNSPSPSSSSQQQQQQQQQQNPAMGTPQHHQHHDHQHHHHYPAPPPPQQQQHHHQQQHNA